MSSSCPADIIVPAGSEIRCHRCSYFCGETSVALALVGVVKPRWLRDRMLLPRQTWLCPHCGWQNVFECLDRPPKSV